MRKSFAKGYTIIELMIVVAIIAILSAIAYPAYLDHTREARLEDAKAALSALAKALERSYTQTVPNTYAGNAQADGTPEADFFPATAPLNSDNAFYDLTIEDADESEFEVRATAIAGVDVDPDCTPLALFSNGTRTPAGCW